jgi:hypothetical protein
MRRIINIIIGAAVVLGSCSEPVTRPAVPVPVSIEQTGYVHTTQELESDSIPDSVYLLVNLRALSVKGMDCDFRDSLLHCWALSAIPARIGNLTKLESLSLPVNAISSIPRELGELQNLKSIDLSDNGSLSDIGSIVKIKGLVSLGLNGCQISRLPENIGELKSLQELGLVGNPIGAAERERIRKALRGCRVLF